MSTPEQGRPVKPVLGEPGLSPEYYDDDDQPRLWSVGWDLSWGCRVSISHEDDGSLRATVNVSGQVQQNGIAVRRVTRDQVLDYAAKLVRLVSEDPATESSRWSVVNDQFIADGPETVAMAGTPLAAAEIASLLNAQQVGTVAAEARCAQRIEDLQAEFKRQWQGIERSAERTRASHVRLLDNLEAFVADHSDPGTEALSAIYEARQLRTRPATTPRAGA